MSDTLLTTGLRRAARRRGGRGRGHHPRRARRGAHRARGAAPPPPPAAAAGRPRPGRWSWRSVLEELRIAARAGQEARAIQLRQDRDDTISAAISGGFTSVPRAASTGPRQWDADPEGAQAALATLTGGEPLFPVGDAPATAATRRSHGAYTDDMAAQDAELFGLPKEAFAR
jgi:hypothetical protein